LDDAAAGVTARLATALDESTIKATLINGCLSN